MSFLPCVPSFVQAWSAEWLETAGLNSLQVCVCVGVCARHPCPLGITSAGQFAELTPPPVLCCSLTSLCDGFLLQAEFTVKGSGAEAILTDVVVHQTAIAEHPTLRSHKVTVVAVSTNGSLIFEQDVVIKAQVGT